MKPLVPSIPKLTLDIMRFVEMVLADPDRNLSRAYQSVYHTVNKDSAKSSASRLWKGPTVAAYLAYLESGNKPEQTADMIVDPPSVALVKSGEKLLEAAALTRRQCEALAELQLTHGPTDLLDENLKPLPHLSHLLDSYKVTIRTDKDGNETRTVEIKVPGRKGMLETYYKMKDFQPEKDVTGDEEQRKAIEERRNDPEYREIVRKHYEWVMQHPSATLADSGPPDQRDEPDSH